MRPRRIRRGNELLGKYLGLFSELQGGRGAFAAETAAAEQLELVYDGLQGGRGAFAAETSIPAGSLLGIYQLQGGRGAFAAETSRRLALRPDASEGFNEAAAHSPRKPRAAALAGSSIMALQGGRGAFAAETQGLSPEALKNIRFNEAAAHSPRKPRPRAVGSVSRGASMRPRRIRRGNQAERIQLVNLLEELQGGRGAFAAETMVAHVWP